MLKVAKWDFHASSAAGSWHTFLGRKGAGAQRQKYTRESPHHDFFPKFGRRSVYRPAKGVLVGIVKLWQPSFWRLCKDHLGINMYLSFLFTSFIILNAVLCMQTLSSAQRTEIRRLMIHAVLSTDMWGHLNELCSVNIGFYTKEIHIEWTLQGVYLWWPNANTENVKHSIQFFFMVISFCIILKVT